jgi:hypothetical protein
MVTSGRCACYFRKPMKTHLNAVGGIAVPQSIFLSLAEEAFMRGTNWGKAVVGMSAIVCALLTGAEAVRGQSAGEGDSGGAGAAHDSSQPLDLAAVGSLLKQLQAQVQELNTQVQELKTQRQSEQAEAAELRRELDAAKSRQVAMSGPGNSVAAAQVLPGSTTQTAPASTSTSASTEERITKLEENQQLADQKAAEQNQTKVESSSKYRVRLSGMVLFNMSVNRGTVDNADFPQLAMQPGPLSSSESFVASLRQSQIGLQAFGPTIAGARTSADIQFDFAGGFPEAPNGVSFGIMRLRTGTIRFDWQNTSVVAGQDSLFFAPLSPTSIATLAVPALAYAGNLWSWTPQVRVEHKFTLSDSSSLLLQGGILDDLSGDTPPSEYYRYPSWGERSGQPAFATRLAWTKKTEGQDLTLGFGGYYGRQAWGYDRSIDSWAGTVDLTVPLGSKFEFTGQFYRGRAVGGLGGGIGQTGLWVGSLLDPTTEVYGLQSMGGWAQLKFKATPKLQFNGAFGQDNPFASDMRQFGGSQPYYTSPLSKNQSAFGNFIYQLRSDIVFSLEYRRLKTFTLDNNANAANLVTLSVGYIF